MKILKLIHSARSKVLARISRLFYNRFPTGGEARPVIRILVEPDQIENWQQQKRVCFLLLRLTAILLVLGLEARFAPPINDWLSGPAEPMRAIAQQLAKASAAATAQQYPIIVMHSENLSCQNAQHTNSDDYDAVLYLIAYSEKTRSLCLTTLVHFPSEPTLPNTTTLSESMGRNYGHPLPFPLKAVPIENRLTTYPEQYLSLLHWRKKVVFPLAHAGQLNAHTLQFAPNGPADSVGMDLGFQDLRAAVAERHNAINRALSIALTGISLLFASLAIALWTIFRRVRRYCYRAFDFAVTFDAFLFGDLSTVVRQVQRQYLVRQQELQEQIRAQRAVQHFIDEARERLQFLLEGVPDEKLRAEIRSCLDHNQLEEMNAVFEHYRVAAGQKTPEERLSLLLESLRPYCSSAEFEEHRKEAFAVLQRSGFRPAREFVVCVHDEQREKFKKSAEQTAPEDLEDTA